MANQETRQKLIDTTKKLLLKGVDPTKLTARIISSEAETNLAMINYCFKSKDELIKIAVEQIISDEFNEYASYSLGQTAMEQLRNLLIYVCNITIKYQQLTKVSIPYLLLEEEIQLPIKILPFIKKHFENKKSELECKMIAFQIVYSMQLIFYRSEDFNKYMCIDINDAEQLEKLIDLQLNLYY